MEGHAQDGRLCKDEVEREVVVESLVVTIRAMM